MAGSLRCIVFHLGINRRACMWFILTRVEHCDHPHECTLSQANPSSLSHCVRGALTLMLEIHGRSEQKHAGRQVIKST